MPSPTDERFLFTVFTPTRNRGHVLHRVYESLVSQTFRGFEWLVIDNSSTDDTPVLMERWQDEAAFPIRYLYQAVDIGVQGSWRRALAEARGELFLLIRSADTFVPTALERFKFHWDSIPARERDAFSAVTALAVDEHGRLNGTQFPRPVIDSNSLEIRHRYRVTGEKWGFQRTNVLRAYPPPEIVGYTSYMPESIMWRAIARRYQTRFVNEVLRTYWRDQSSSNSAPSDPAVNAPGRLLAAEYQLNQDLSWLRYDLLGFFREAVIYVRSGWYVGRPLMEQVKALQPVVAKILWLVALPVGTLVYLAERRPPMLRRQPRR